MKGLPRSHRGQTVSTTGPDQGSFGEDRDGLGEDFCCSRHSSAWFDGLALSQRGWGSFVPHCWFVGRLGELCPKLKEEAILLAMAEEQEDKRKCARPGSELGHCRFFPHVVCQSRSHGQPQSWGVRKYTLAMKKPWQGCECREG